LDLKLKVGCEVEKEAEGVVESPYVRWEIASTVARTGQGVRAGRTCWGTGALGRWGLAWRAPSACKACRAIGGDKAPARG
jgi:hypothetical protein